jgi:hypothetical protein
VENKISLLIFYLEGGYDGGGKALKGAIRSLGSLRSLGVIRPKGAERPERMKGGKG